MDDIVDLIDTEFQEKGRDDLQDLLETRLSWSQLVQGKSQGQDDIGELRKRIQIAYDEHCLDPEIITAFLRVIGERLKAFEDERVHSEKQGNAVAAAAMVHVPAVDDCGGPGIEPGSANGKPKRKVKKVRKRLIIRQSDESKAAVGPFPVASSDSNAEDENDDDDSEDENNGSNNGSHNNSDDDESHDGSNNNSDSNVQTLFSTAQSITSQMGLISLLYRQL